MLEQVNTNALLLFTVTEDHETGENHIVEAVHRLFLHRARKFALATTLFVQLNNYTRENNNIYLLGFLDALI